MTATLEPVEGPTEAIKLTAVLEILLEDQPDPLLRPWIIPTQNSVYEVDFVRQRARQTAGANTTECFSPQGEWRSFQSCSIGYGGCFVFMWTRSAPHTMTTTSAVRPGAIRYSEALDS